MIKILKIIAMLFFTVALSAENQITYYEIEIPRYLDPVYGGKTSDGQRVASLLFRSLYGFDRVRNFVPNITEGMPEITPEKNMIVTLKPNMKWHNDKPVTAENVIRSMDILGHAGTDYSRKSIFDRFSGIIERDGRTIEFVNNPNNPATEYSLVFPVLPTNYLASVSLQRNSEFTQRKPIGNGPFRLEARERDRLIFKRFDDFIHASTSGEHTNIDKIICREVSLMGVWAQDIRAGLTDVLINVPQHEIDNLQNLQNIRLHPYPNYSIELLAFNMQNTLLSEPFIRLAMIHGTNRQDMINGILMRHADMATGPYPSGSYYDWQELIPRRYDPKYARKILSDAGCKIDADGIFRYQGKKLSFNFLHITDEQLIDNGFFTDFQRQMREIGIEIQNPISRDYYSYVEDILQRNYEIALVNIIYDEALDISDTYKTNGSMNFMSYSNSEVDQLLENLKNTSDPLMKQLIGNRIHQAVYNDPPAIFLWTRQRYAAYNSARISRFEVHPINFFYLVDEWRYNP